MGIGRVHVRHIDTGALHCLEGAAQIGRGEGMALRLRDLFSSRSAAALSPRRHMILLVRVRGALRVDGESGDAFPVRVGHEWWFAPSDRFVVVGVEPASEGEPTTIGGAALGYWRWLERGAVEVSRGAERLEIRDTPAALLAMLLASDDHRCLQRDVLARFWQVGGDLVTLRNRLDQLVATTNRALAPLAASLPRFEGKEARRNLVFSRDPYVCLGWDPEDRVFR